MVVGLRILQFISGIRKCHPKPSFYAQSGVVGTLDVGDYDYQRCAVALFAFNIAFLTSGSLKACRGLVNKRNRL